MAAIRGFIAASLDGYVADATGGVAWLKPFESVDYGYARFIAEIGTIVLGRTTYDQIPSFGVGWPYPGKRGLIVTSRPCPNLYAGVEAWSAGVGRLIDHLRGLTDGDVWIVGGAKLQAAFIEAGGLDRLELFVIPLLLGDGVPLFPKTTFPPRSLHLAGAAALDKGMVHLDYRLG